MRKTRFINRFLKRYHIDIIPSDSTVLHIGCGEGNLLNALKPRDGTGIDISKEKIEKAKNQYPHLSFFLEDPENIRLNKKFDYVIISNTSRLSADIQQIFRNLKQNVHQRTRLILTGYNVLWRPLFDLVDRKTSQRNWLSTEDIEGLLNLEGFQKIKVDQKILFPWYIPFIHFGCNKFLANLPFIRKFNLMQFTIARPLICPSKEYSVSIVVPARNEKGNIENVILQTPDFGSHQQFVFIEGHSSDGTYEEIIYIKDKYPDRDIYVMKQSGHGKGNAVREAFDTAKGEVLMILDADLTTPPEDMPKFYEALANNHGEFINGCRLSYPMENGAMRPLNLVGNRFFGWILSYLCGQRLKDTLCGTKVLFKKDYEIIKANRGFFGGLDPFGDFDLILGATKLNLKMVEVMVKYKGRSYGCTQISRFKDGFQLLKMSYKAALKLKFNS